jgi:hypothetical protein
MLLVTDAAQPVNVDAVRRLAMVDDLELVARAE